MIKKKFLWFLSAIFSFFIEDALHAATDCDPTNGATYQYGNTKFRYCNYYSDTRTNLGYHPIGEIRYYCEEVYVDSHYADLEGRACCDDAVGACGYTDGWSGPLTIPKCDFSHICPEQGDLSGTAIGCYDGHGAPDARYDDVYICTAQHFPGTVTQGTNCIADTCASNTYYKTAFGQKFKCNDSAGLPLISALSGKNICEICPTYSPISGTKYGVSNSGFGIESCKVPAEVDTFFDNSGTFVYGNDCPWSVTGGGY